MLLVLRSGLSGGTTANAGTTTVLEATTATSASATAVNAVTSVTSVTALVVTTLVLVVAVLTGRSIVDVRSLLSTVVREEKSLDELVGSNLVLPLLFSLVVILGLPGLDLDGAEATESGSTVEELDCSLGSTDGLIEDVGVLGVLVVRLSQLDGNDGGSSLLGDLFTLSVGLN